MTSEWCRLLDDDGGYLLERVLTYIHIYELTTRTCYTSKKFYLSSKLAVLRNGCSYSREEYTAMFLSKGIGKVLLANILTNSKSINLKFSASIRIGSSFDIKRQRRFRFHMGIDGYCFVREFYKCAEIFTKRFEKEVGDYCFVTEVMKRNSGIFLSFFHNSENGFMGKDSLLKSFLEKDARRIWIRRGLLMAASRSNLEVFTRLLKISDDFPSIFEDGYPGQILLNAVRSNNLEVVKCILDTNKFDLTKYGTFALKIAAQCGYYEICKVLIDLYDINVFEDDHFVLRRAVKYGRTECFDLFLEYYRRNQVEIDVPLKKSLIEDAKKYKRIDIFNKILILEEK